MDDVNPRAYRSGTEKALFEMGSGTCYFPDCETRTIVFIEGEPLVNVQIAHIEGAEPGSARYREEMTNEERRSFSNLLLLCVPHHDLVDNKKPHIYDTPTLRGWKAAREPAVGTASINQSGITEETLVAAIEAAVKASRGVREVDLEVVSGTLIENGSGLIKVPLGQYPVVSRGSEVEKNVVLTVRNTGDLQVAVEGVAIYFTVGGDPGVQSKLMGRDDYVGRNPRLPCRIESGVSKTWMTALATFAMIYREHASRGHEVTHFSFEVDLGTGDSLRSAAYEMDVIRPDEWI